LKQQKQQQGQWNLPTDWAILQNKRKQLYKVGQYCNQDFSRKAGFPGLVCLNPPVTPLYFFNLNL